MSHAKKNRQRRLLATIGPGLLVAATGVGAGDLATATLSGSEVGTAVLWAVLVGAFLKFVLNEGLARWQIATGQTLLEGVVEKCSLAVVVIFLPYLLAWSFFVGAALMSACGVTFHALCPVMESAEGAKQVFGILHSVLGVVLVLLGGFRLFEKVMTACIGVMFVIVVVTAGCLWPGSGEVLRGLVVPHPATLQGTSLIWTVALMGGVGGTVTVLCYGYWIRESGRVDEKDLSICRIDLGVAYSMTALFGICMVIIGSTVAVEPGSRGARLIVDLAARLDDTLGPVGKWAFLIGAWGTVFSSLLGVWQAVPYLFADLWGQISKRRAPEGPARIDTRSLPYLAALCFIATVPVAGLFFSFKTIQKVYAITGAAFIPLLALVLLVLNGRSQWVGPRLRNRWPTVLALVAALAFFVWFGWMQM